MKVLSSRRDVALIPHPSPLQQSFHLINLTAGMGKITKNVIEDHDLSTEKVQKLLTKGSEIVVLLNSSNNLGFDQMSSFDSIFAIQIPIQPKMTNCL